MKLFVLRKSLFLLAISLLILILFSLPQTVYAQDEQPAEADPVSTPILEESIPLEEAPPIEVSGNEEFIETSAAPLAEVLVEAGMVITDQNGEPVSLASQVAEDAIASADPYFTCVDDSVDGVVDGICRYFGLGGIQAAVADFSTRLGSGNIFIEDAGIATDYTGAVTISAIPGLTGLVGTSTLTSSPSSLITLNGSININNQLTGFNLSGLTILGNQAGALVSLTGNTGLLTLSDLVIKNDHASGDALLISSHTGNATLTEIKADRNGDEGANIDLTGNLVITNSSFNMNSGLNALSITSNGSVSLNGVSASGNNAGDGAHIYALKGITVRNGIFTDNYDGVGVNTIGDGLEIVTGSKGVVLIENSFINYNQETGLRIDNNGSVSFKNIQLKGNTYAGIYLDNCSYYLTTCSYTSSPVTLNNVTIDGSQHPLNVFSNGNISLTGVTSLFAGNDHGAQLRNEYANAPRTVSVSNSDFSYASFGGLYIISRGAVSLNKITSGWAGNGSGVFVDNSIGTAGVTVTNSMGNSKFDSNSAFGLWIFSRGAISVTGVDAIGNDYNNIYLDNSTGTGSVTLASAIVSGSATTDGIRIDSNGAIILKNVSSTTNYFGKGAVLNNTMSPSSPGVTITSSVFSNNIGIGLDLSTKGNVVINGIVTYQNTGGNVGTSINTLSGPGNVTITNGTFNSNSSHGLVITTNGAITLSKITAIYNGNTGVNLDNSLPPVGVKPVTINGMDVGYNALKGLNVLSKGAVKITNLIADYMSGGSDAVRIDTLGIVSIGATGTFLNSISNNFTNGLTITANGAISLSNITSSGSVNGYGADLSFSGPSGSVKIVNGDFNYNKTYGLTIHSNGAITLTNVHVNNNLEYGASLINYPGTGGITVNGGSTASPNSFSYNKTGGLHASTTGSVSLVNIVANNNDNLSLSGNGIAVTTTTGNLTFANVTANQNGAHGIWASSGGGSISLANAISYNNKLYGTYLTNATVSTPKSVTVKNLTSNSNQGFNGLFIESAGNVLLTNLKMNNTALAEGLYVDNRYGTAASTITINGTPGAGSTFNNNAFYGARLYSDGVITVSMVEATGNPQNGIYLDNLGGTGGISLTKTNVSGSSHSGITIYSNGVIALSEVSSTFNGHSTSSGWGADIINTTGAAKITIKSSTFSDNYSGGLYAASNAGITATNVIAENNAHSMGLYLDSSGPISVLSTGGFMNKMINNNTENLNIISGGDVLLQNIFTQYNTSGFGVVVMNTSGTGKVTIQGINVRNNTSGGLYVESNGSILISNATAYGNSGQGMYLYNSGGSGTVTLKNVTNSFNSSYGLSVMTNGITTLDKVDIYYNTIAGAQINIGNPLSTLTISRSSFDNNNNGGLSANLGGNVVLNTVSASNNTSLGARGAFIDNFSGTGTVTVLSTYGANSFSNNADDGLYVFSNGEFKGNNITANDNGWRGLEIYNGAGSAGVSITGGVFNRNGRSGIFIYSSADVLINGVQVMGNGGADDIAGIYVDTGGNITLANSVTTGNGKEGIYALSGSMKSILIFKSLFFGNNRWNPYDSDPNITAINGILTIVR